MLRLPYALRSSLITSAIRRHTSCCSGGHKLSEAEQQIGQLLTDGIEGCSRVEVHDVSNGCGSMFDVLVEASSFKGKTKVAQHKIVTSILKEQIKGMHGLTISTKVA